MGHKAYDKPEEETYIDQSLKAKQELLELAYHVHIIFAQIFCKGPLSSPRLFLHPYV